MIQIAWLIFSDVQFDQIIKQYYSISVMSNSGNWKKTVIIAFVIRAFLILLLSTYESIYHHQLTITDIDYKVYSDSTLYPSPYQRQTYRYSPFLSYLMNFNYTVHQSIGKLILAAFDSLAIGLLYAIMSRNNTQQSEKNTLANAELTAKLYAYNPLFIYLTVRGSCESITLAFMYAFWYYYFGGTATGNQSYEQMKTNRVQSTQPEKWKRWTAYAIYGLWVHLRIYPIIFLPLILMHQFHARGGKWINVVKQIVEIGIISGGIFIATAIVFYLMYGQKFIEETFLYHFTRKDNRHSFSPYFYEIYLNYDNTTNEYSRSLIRVIPFLYILLTLTFRFTKNYSLFYLQFLLTFGFVAFNKVITLQYYMWIFGSLLLVLPQSLIYTMKKYRMGVGLVIQYFFPVIIWIWLSLRLEDAGQNYLHVMWIICLFQVYMQLWVLVSFMKTVKRYNPLQQKRMKLQKAKKMLSGKND